METLTVLRSCANLSPWAEKLQTVRRYCDLLAIKAFNDNHDILEDADSNGKCQYNGISNLPLDHFMRVVTTVNGKTVQTRYYR
ncbi:hypothetical protein YC2023_105824 [Brassica napus]